MTNARDDQRESSRHEEKPSASPEPFRFSLPKARQESRCSVPAAVVPDVFITPTPCPPVIDPTKLIPGPLLIGNDELTLNCSDVDDLGPLGNPFTMGKGAVTHTVYFTEIPNITGVQLDRIARLTPPQLASLAEEATLASVVVQLTGLKESQAEFLKARVAAVTTAVQLEVIETASASLVCVWLNAEQVVVCPELALANPSYPEEGVNNPITVSAGAVSSALSQEDADQQAVELANLELGCVWGNDTITVDCSSLGYIGEIPNDPGPQGSASRARVGSFTIAANTIFSIDGKGDANEIARAQAELSLACFFINEGQVVDCEEEGFPGAVVFPVDAADNIGGSPVTVPAGFIESEISQVDANERAVDLGLSFLDCFWYNVEKTAACPALTLEDGEEIPPHLSSPTLEVIVQAGEIISRISQADADQQAQARADLSLRCVYCNLQVDPECLPPDVVNPPIPIPIESVGSHWSIDATLGVAEDTFCGEDGTVQTLARTVNFPATPHEGACAYDNDEVVAGCIYGVGVIGLFDSTVGADLSELSRPNPFAANPNDRTITVAAGIARILDINVPGTFRPADPQRYKKWANLEAERLALTLLNCFFGNDEYTAACEPDAEAHPVHDSATSSAVVPANFFQSYSSKAEADAQAEIYGDSLLDCFWMNTEITATCETYNPQDDGQYHPFSNTSVTVPADTYMSYIGEDNANFFAREIAESGLNCLYTNVVQVPDTCPEGTNSYSNLAVAADTTVSSISGSDADLQAKTLANAGRVCLDPDQVGGGPGADGEDGEDGQDGQDGAQTGCSGNCYGYFS